MAWENYVTMNGQRQYQVAFDFDKYEYRAYAEYLANGRLELSVFLNGQFNSVVWSTYQDGTYFTFSRMAGNATYDVTPLTGNDDTRSIVKIQRNLKNTAPSTPGSFTQPTGILEIGDTKVVSWGASSHAEGNLADYELSVRYDGGNWSVLNSNNKTTSANFVVPNATKIEFRVRARDNVGLYSGYVFAL